MSGTLRVLRAELARLLRVRATWATLATLAALSAVRTLAGLVWTAAERGGATDPLSSGLAWAPFVDGWKAGLLLGTLVLLAFAARTLAGDRETGVLRLATTRSATRSAVVLGRLALAPLVVLGLVAATGLGAWIAAGSTGDFGPLVEDGYELASAAELRGEVLRAVLAILPGLCATFAFGLLLGAVTRGAASAVLGALGSFLAFDLFKVGLGDAGLWVFASHVPTPFDTSAWAELAGVARGYSDAVLSEAALRAAWIAPWPALVLCTGLACVVLGRRTL